MRDLRPKKKKKKKKACSFFFSSWNREGAGFTAVGGRKETVLEGVSFVQKQRGRREICDFSHSHFHQRLESHLWSDLDEISVCCS